MTKVGLIGLVCMCAIDLALGQEYHVAMDGSNTNPGTQSQPFRTISKAASAAEPGARVVVHEGIYREHVDPPRGGVSNDVRIVFEAAPGEKVQIKGSEVIRDWTRFKEDVWKVRIPHAYFGNFNPFVDLVAGDWFVDFGRTHHLGDIYLNGRSMFEVALLEQVLNPSPLLLTDMKEASTYTWFTESDEAHVYLYANFPNMNPNQERVEITVRPACFYPTETGINYITVRGFDMSQAATQWAPPTAEQVGLLGTNWSKGWVIEDNVIHDSRCAGITLGKDRASGQNIWSADPSVDGATHYNDLILTILREPYNWSKEHIGSHVVRRNTIYNCEQAGICGSMGCAFSVIEDNHIYDIWTKRQFGGAEIAGIKLHGAIDAVIRNNRINNALKGIWLDWMTQGTRVTGNLVYDIYKEDFFVEVNHGPFTVDNNLFLGNGVGLLDGSSGGAYLHNLIRGKIVIVQQDRKTPYHQPHSTTVWGHAITENADNRFYNNWFSSVDDKVNEAMPDPWWIGRGTYGLAIYDGYAPMYVDGNVYWKAAERFPGETNGLAVTSPSGIHLEENENGLFLSISIDPLVLALSTRQFGTEGLGRVKTSDMRFENPDGSPFVIDQDYLGRVRDVSPTSGPFEQLKSGLNTIKVWPKN